MMSYPDSAKPPVLPTSSSIFTTLGTLPLAGLPKVRVKNVGQNKEQIMRTLLQCSVLFAFRYQEALHNLEQPSLGVLIT